MKDYKSLNHTKWECKYHVVFIPKRRSSFNSSISWSLVLSWSCMGCSSVGKLCCSGSWLTLEPCPSKTIIHNRKCCEEKALRLASR
jgi:hypothetical protein